MFKVKGEHLMESINNKEKNVYLEQAKIEC